MYYAAKIIQATGLGVIFIGFIKDFPRLMNPRVFGIGILIFLLGWGIQHFMLKR